MNENLFFLCGFDEDEFDERFQKVGFLCYEVAEFCSSSASSVIVGRGKVAIWARVFN
jgi:hypothetical protein